MNIWLPAHVALSWEQKNCFSVLKKYLSKSGLAAAKAILLDFSHSNGLVLLGVGDSTYKGFLGFVCRLGYV
jgi:hypothetical protein